MALSFPPPPRAFDRQLIFSFQKEVNHPRRLSWRIQYPNFGAMGKGQMPYPWDSVKIILYSNVVLFSWALIERDKSIFYLANSLLEFDFDCYSWSQLHGMVLSGAHHLEPATTPYSCHGVFTDWSIFSLNLSRIQIPTGTPVNNCNHKHGLTLTCRHILERPHCFMLSEACSCRLELAYFAGKTSKNRLVCKNAVALAYYGSCRLLVMGSWYCMKRIEIDSSSCFICRLGAQQYKVSKT